MTSQPSAAGKPTVLALTGELTIYRALELKELLLAQPLADELDLSGVTEIDTAGVQLIMLAKKTALASQRAMRLVAHSPAVIEVFELLNVAAYFDDPLVMAPPAAAHERSTTATSARKPHGH